MSRVRTRPLLLLLTAIKVAPFKMQPGAVHSSPLPSAAPQRAGWKGSGRATVLSHKCIGLAQIQFFFLRSLLVKLARDFFHLLNAPYLLVPEGSSGGARMNDTAPYPVDPRGIWGRRCRVFVSKKEQNAVRFSRVGFVGVLPMGKRQIAVHFSLSIFHGQVYRLNSPSGHNCISTPAMVAQDHNTAFHAFSG